MCLPQALGMERRQASIGGAGPATSPRQGQARPDRPPGRAQCPFFPVESGSGAGGVRNTQRDSHTDRTPRHAGANTEQTRPRPVGRQSGRKPASKAPSWGVTIQTLRRHWTQGDPTEQRDTLAPVHAQTHAHEGQNTHTPPMTTRLNVTLETTTRQTGKNQSGHGVCRLRGCGGCSEAQVGFGGWGTSGRGRPRGHVRPGRAASPDQLRGLRWVRGRPEGGGPSARRTPQH